ncbi:unnamed protein product [Urochloa humidicola]
MSGGKSRGKTTARDPFKASKGQFLAPGYANAGSTAAGAALACDGNKQKNYTRKSATMKNFPAESSSHPHNPSSLPEGVQFLLHTLPVEERHVGDGDGFTVFVKTTDPLSDAINQAEYKIVKGSGNRKIIARKYRIRMRGIDAPELKMEYGKESRIALRNLIKDKCVEIYVYGKDKYHRYVGDIYCEGVFIQEQMLKRGCAWHFKVYDQRIEFGQWESEARTARQGLWLSDNPKKPWEWKEEQRNTHKQYDIQMDNVTCEALSRMIEEDAEEKVTMWEKSWESVVAENKMLKGQLLELKEKTMMLTKEEEDVEEKAMMWEKSWQNVVAENKMLKGQLLELKEKAMMLTKEEADDEEKAMMWEKSWQNVVAENKMLKDQLLELKEKAMMWEKECESVVAENRMLNGQLCELREKDMMLEKGWERIVAENRMLKGQLQELKELQNEKSLFKKLIKQMAIGVGTSVLIIGVAVLFRRPPPPKKKDVAAVLFRTFEPFYLR